MVIIISEDRYKLHLTSEQLDLLKRVFDNHDWFCNCESFPDCKDFKMYMKLKKRVDTLLDRHFDSQGKGIVGYHKMIRNVRSKHTKDVLDIVKR